MFATNVANLSAGQICRVHIAIKNSAQNVNEAGSM